MWQRLTERANRVLVFAQEEAVRLGEDPVGTAHLLLGLIRERDSVSARLLARLGVSLDRIQAELERRATPVEHQPEHERELSPRIRRVIDLAYEEGRALHNNHIGTEHLLLGLVREGEGIAARILEAVGVTLDDARRELYAMQESDAELAAFTQTLRERLKRLIPAMDEPESIDEANGHDTPLRALRWLAGQAVKCRSVTAASEASRVAVELARTVCKGRTDLLTTRELSTSEAWALLALARVFKATLGTGKTVHRDLLPGKALAMIFEKPSLRTRTSFETGMFQLGGHALYLQPSDISMGKRESVADVAHNLERMVDGIMARVFAHGTLVELAEHSRVPVINGLCDVEHPCQTLSDLLTVWERRGTIAGQKIAYVGDGNNVAHSLMLLGAKLGAHVVIASPPGYEPDPDLVSRARADGAPCGGFVDVTADPRAACAGADVIYTDVWTSMGQEAEAEERRKVFASYQVNEALLALAKPDALFLHCLPAHRGEEVSAAVMDGPQSVVFDQAENRLHAQKAVLAVLLG